MKYKFLGTIISVFVVLYMQITYLTCKQTHEVSFTLGRVITTLHNAVLTLLKFWKKSDQATI